MMPEGFLTDHLVMNYVSISFYSRTYIQSCLELPMIYANDIAPMCTDFNFDIWKQP